ncbi:MAG: excinuclease ABC subunit UvrA [Dissulfuribacterales bacterium]
MGKQIILKGVTQHNLKGFDLTIPLGQITVITGPSGSGKSTLAIDVLFAEGQHRYLESMGLEIKRLIRLWERPKVQLISGLPPPLLLEHNYVPANLKTNVANLTDISTFLRNLFAQIGELYCPSCQHRILTMTIGQMADRLYSLPEGTKLTLLAPVTQKLKKRKVTQILEQLAREGFVRVRINNEQTMLSDIGPEIREINNLEAVVDRIILKHGSLSRLTDSLRIALKLGDGVVKAEVQNSPRPIQYLTFTERPFCPNCFISFPAITPQIFSAFHMDGACQKCDGRGCSHCENTGLNPFSRAVKILNHSIHELMRKNVQQLAVFIEQLLSTISNYKESAQRYAAEELIKAIQCRLQSMERLGLGYIPLNMPLKNLSGGEIQRIRLSAQLGRSLTGVLYVLDEPTCGLHPKEQDALWKELLALKEMGNTIILVEHDLSSIMQADYLVELGTGAGKRGGKLIYAGPPEGLKECHLSITRPYLTDETALSRKKKAFSASSPYLMLQHIFKNNLKNISVTVPLNALVCVTGVSGSGKSSLVSALHEALLQRNPSNAKDTTGTTPSLSLHHAEILPLPRLIDQQPLFRSKFSMPATYLGVFSHIKKLFSMTQAARASGYGPSHFNLMQKGGRCEACQGQGFIFTDVEYLPPIKSICEICGGARYNRDTLQIRYKGHNIAEILHMTIEEAHDFFAKLPYIRKPLKEAMRIGLGYLQLGQWALDLSGGECQRLKLCQALIAPSRRHNIYLMDEPSRGMHLCDIQKLMEIWDELIEHGHSIVIIEHMKELVTLCDCVIELGPEGGPGGGNVVKFIWT